MGSFADELGADLADAVGDYDQTFSWNGLTIACVRTTAAAALAVLPGGLEESVSDRIIVALEDLPTGTGQPASGDLVDGSALQILKTDPNVGHIVLWCGPPMNMGER